MCESTNQGSDLYPVQTVVSPSRERGGDLGRAHRMLRGMGIVYFVCSLIGTHEFISIFVFKF